MLAIANLQWKATRTHFFGISLKRCLHPAPVSEPTNAVKFSHGGDAMGCRVSFFKKYAAFEVAASRVGEVLCLITSPHGSSFSLWRKHPHNRLNFTT